MDKPKAALRIQNLAPQISQGYNNAFISIQFK